MNYRIPNPGRVALWPAASRLNTNVSELNPCTGSTYPANLDAWVIYGPFSLTATHNATFDFLYYLDSESNDDELFWGASLDGQNFQGEKISGTYTQGPFPSNTGDEAALNFSHNYVSFDLTNVPNLGDLTGQSQVWVAVNFKSDADENSGQGAFIDELTIRTFDGIRQEIEAENFDGTPFPNEAWASYDLNNLSGNGTAHWGAVNCQANSGANALWVGRSGEQGVDPCTNVNFAHSTNVNSWLMYGPFNLNGANAAWVDFYFKSNTQKVLTTTNGTYSLPNMLNNSDTFWVWSSTDGNTFTGPGYAGNFVGPYGANGYNRFRYDLSKAYIDNVGVDVSLLGQRTVWLAFVLDGNDDTITNTGTFIDDVRVSVEYDPAVYLPSLLRQIPPTPTPTTTPENTPTPTPTATPVPAGGFTFTNETNNPVFIELFNADGSRFGDRSFASTAGPHKWTNIPPGTYDWLASGTCPKGSGQVGSHNGRGRAPITIVDRQNNAAINVENGGKFDCSG